MKFRITERFDMNFQDVKQSGAWQLVLPKGKIFTRGYGQVNFDDGLLEDMVRHWRDKVMGQRQPYIDTDHDFGESNGWIKDMRVGSDGLEVKIDWTPAGVKKLTEQTYKYFSGSIGSAVDPKTGKDIFPVLLAASLTNTPQIYVLPPAQLSDKNLGGPGSGRYPKGSGGGGKGKSTAETIKEHESNIRKSSGETAGDQQARLQHQDFLKGEGTRGDILDDDPLIVHDTKFTVTGDQFDGEVVLEIPADDPNYGGDPNSDFDARRTTNDEARDLFERQLEYNGKNAFNTKVIDSVADTKKLWVGVLKQIDRTHVKIGYTGTLTYAAYQRYKSGDYSDAEPGSHGGDHDGEGDQEGSMTFAELKDKLKGMKLSDEERKSLLDQLGVTEKELDDESHVELSEQVRVLKTTVESYKDANTALNKRLDDEVKARRSKERDEVIELALSDGRIIPADKEKWVKRYDAAPEQVREILESLPKTVDFSEHGHKGGGGEQKGHVVTFADKTTMTLSEDDLAAAEKLHQSPAQYASILTGKKLPA